MHKQHKASEKRKAVILQLELLENRISPATLDVTHFGSASGGPGREYPISDVYAKPRQPRTYHVPRGKPTDGVLSNARRNGLSSQP